MDKFVKCVATPPVNPAPAKTFYMVDQSWIVMSMLLDLTILDITRNLGVVYCCLDSTRLDSRERSRITIFWRLGCGQRDESKTLLRDITTYRIIQNTRIQYTVQ